MRVMGKKPLRRRAPRDAHDRQAAPKGGGICNVFVSRVAFFCFSLFCFFYFTSNVRLNGWVSSWFGLYCLGWISYTHGEYVCVQLTRMCWWESCLPCSSVVVFFLSVFYRPLNLLLGRAVLSSFILCFGLFPRVNRQALNLWFAWCFGECYFVCSLFCSPSVSRLPLTFVFGLAPVFSFLSRLSSLSLSLSSVCVGAPCKPPNNDSNLF